MSPQGPSPSPPARPTPLPVVTHAPAHTHSVFPVPPRLMCIRPAHLSVPHQPVGQGRVQAGSPSVSLPARPWPQGTIQQLAGFSVVPGTVLNPHARPVPQPHRSAPALLMRVHACVLLSPSFRDRDTKAWRWTALAQGHMVGGGGALLILRAQMRKLRQRGGLPGSGFTVHSGALSLAEDPAPYLVCPGPAWEVELPREFLLQEGGGVPAREGVHQQLQGHLGPLPGPSVCTREGCLHTLEPGMLPAPRACLSCTPGGPECRALGPQGGRAAHRKDRPQGPGRVGGYEHPILGGWMARPGLCQPLL